MPVLTELRLFNCDALLYEEIVLPPLLERLSIGNRKARLMDADRVVSQLGPRCRHLWLDHVDVTAETLAYSRLGLALTHLAIGHMHFTNHATARAELLIHICVHYRGITDFGVNFCQGVSSNNPMFRAVRSTCNNSLHFANEMHPHPTAASSDGSARDRQIAHSAATDLSA